MQVFLYEHITGGGLLSAAAGPSGSLLREGLAMVTVLADDLAALEDVEAKLLWDRRLPPPELLGAGLLPVANPAEQRRMFRCLAAESDWTIVIAPEFDHILSDHCREVAAAGGRLLGPGPDLVDLASDKHATAECLRASRVPVPQGLTLEPGARLPVDFPYPAVLKPRDGAGSQGLQLVRHPHEVAKMAWPARLEAFCPGQGASVAMLGGRSGTLVLEPCRQHLSQDGRFTYEGGSLPLPRGEAQRAGRLAQRVASALPPFIGYLGIDLVLGPAADGSLDCVIEVNPRFTTSYVGLRAAAEQNLAGVMLDLASDASREQLPPLHPQRSGTGAIEPSLVTYRREALAAGIAFDADGRLRLGAHELARA